METPKKESPVFSKMKKNPTAKAVIIIGGVAAFIGLLGVFFKIINFTVDSFNNMQQTIYRK